MTYNGDTEAKKTFLLPKFLDYIEQKDSHASTLTVAETMEFAWKSTTGGHHSYGIKKSEEAGNLLDEGDEILRKVLSSLYFFHLSYSISFLEFYRTVTLIYLPYFLHLPYFLCLFQ